MWIGALNSSGVLLSYTITSLASHMTINTDIYPLLNINIHIYTNAESELELLSKYGPDVHPAILQRLVQAFASLRTEHEQGTLAYPFSAREGKSKSKSKIDV